MVECLEKACQELGEFTTKIELVYPEIKLNEQEQVVKIAMEANNLGFAALTKTGGGVMPHSMAMVSTANLGCGMENVHTSDEFITVENLIKNPQYLVEIIKVITDENVSKNNIRVLRIIENNQQIQIVELDVNGESSKGLIIRN